MQDELMEKEVGREGNTSSGKIFLSGSNKQWSKKGKKDKPSLNLSRSIFTIEIPFKFLLLMKKYSC